MPFESVTCPECSAVDGIIKVETDTYYCPYHKGLFKYVEPRAVTGLREVSFCQCGNVAQGQCDLCRKSTCGDCSGQTIVPIRGCGYLYPREKGKPEKRATLAEAMQAVQMYKVMFAGHDGRQFDLGVGPVFYRDEILPLLTRGRKVRAGVCNSCLSTGWQAAMHAIASGQMCERPSCAAAPADRCACCQGAFCVDHLKQSVGYRPEVARIRSFRASYDWPILAPEPSGLCAICCAERIVDTRAASIEVCDSFAQLERRGSYFSPRHPYYELKERRWLGGDDPLVLKRKVQATGERAQQVLDLRMRQLEASPEPCKRDWIFDHLDVALPDSMINIYKLVLP